METYQGEVRKNLSGMSLFEGIGRCKVKDTVEKVMFERYEDSVDRSGTK